MGSQIPVKATEQTFECEIVMPEPVNDERRLEKIR